MRTGPARPLLVGAALVAALLAVVVLRSGPPAPLPDSAPAHAFSGRRAEAMLRYLLAEGDAHPIGSPPAARVRERLLRVLQQLGYQPSVQEVLSCRDASCARVQNIVGRLPSSGAEGKAVLLMTHYDSVPAGPGVSDSGLGVAAVLEAARALRAGPAPRRPVILLISDGEEAGLLGAQAFRDAHPAFAEVGAVVNLDARGTAGPSLMFETSGDSGWLAAAVAGALPRPRTSSLFVTIYERLPNDTDLTVFREARVPGVNFAFIGDVVHYHTPLDDLAHASAATLQHHGDNALAMVRSLAARDAEPPPPGAAVFFDVLGLLVVRWPAPWSPPLAALAVVLVAVAALRLRRCGRLAGGAVAAGLGAAILTVLLAALLAAAVAWTLRATGAAPRSWVAHPLPLQLAFWLAAIPAPSLAALLLARRAGAAGLWAGAALLLAGGALAAAALLPGVSHLLLVPALCAGLGGLAFSLPAARDEGAWTLAAALPPALALGLVDLPVAVAAYDAMGLMLLPLVTVLAALPLLSLAPAGAGLSRRTLGATAALGGAAVAAAIVAAALAPTASREAPERLPLALYQEETGEARWLATPETGVLPGALRGAAAFGDRREAALPWLPGRRGFSAPAPRLDAPPPELEVLSDRTEGDERRLRARLRSARGARVLSLHVAPAAGLRGISVEGHGVPQLAGRRWPGVRLHTAPRAGTEVELRLPPGAAELVLSDETPGLPPAGAGLAAARPATAVTSHDGDVTIVARRLRF